MTVGYEAYQADFGLQALQTRALARESGRARCRLRLGAPVRPTLITP